MRRIRSRKKSAIIILVIIIPMLFGLINDTHTPFIFSVSGYSVKGDHEVDSDSDIDATANIGDDGATSYVDAQTLDAVDQIITETDTGGGGGNTNDVDNSASDVDASADIGTETDFINAQDILIDSDYMNIQEGNLAGDGIGTEDDIDSDTSDVDSSADWGTQGTFANAQGTTLDSNYMNLQETNDPMSADDEYLSVNGFDANWNDWDHNEGSSPFVSTQDEPTNQLHELSSQNTQVGWFDFPSTSLSGSGISVNISIYSANADGAGNDGFEVYYDETGTGGGTLLCNMQPDTSFAYIVCNLSGTFTSTEIDAMRIYLITTNVGGGDDRYVDHIRMGVNRGAGDNYRLDFEYQWTTADYNEGNEEVAIYINVIGTENLIIEYWSGSWTSLGTASSSGWNNFTATGLTSTTYTIRITGAIEASDTTQNNWDIDLITLHTWTDPNYNFDFEYQWTTADFNEDEHYIKFYVGSRSESENLVVDYWNGGGWTNIGTIDAQNSWHNFTAIGLTTATYTIRITGADEGADTTQTNYDIDLIMLHSYNFIDDFIDTQGDYHTPTDVGTWSNFANTQAVDSVDANIDSGVGDIIDLDVRFATVNTDNDFYRVGVLHGGTGDQNGMTFLVWDQVSTWVSLGNVNNNLDTWYNFTIDDPTYIGATMDFRFYDNNAVEPISFSVDAIVLYMANTTETGGGANYELQWEHQTTTVDEDKDDFALTIYGSATEDMDIQTWNIGGTSWNTALTTPIGSTEQWYNQSIDANAVDETGIVTWRYIGTSESGDSSQSTLNIDYAGISAWNFTMVIIEASLDIPDYKQGSGALPFPENPMRVNVSSGVIYDIQISATDGAGNPITAGYILWDTDSNPTGATTLTASYVDMYTSRPAGDKMITNFYIFLDVAFGIGDGVFGFTLNIQIVPS